MRKEPQGQNMLGQKVMWHNVKYSTERLSEENVLH